jgi:hypothetical protein
MQIPMDSAKAEELKRLLRNRAMEARIDLSNPDNRYTLWAENGGQGYSCWGRAAYPYEVYRLMGHYMFTGAAILEINESGDRVTLFTCEVG